MRARTIAAGVALCALGVTAPPAHAEDVSTYRGGCSFDTVEAPSGSGHWIGQWDAKVVLYSRTYGNAVAADVSCVLQINGVTQATATQSGTGVVVFAAPLEFTAGPYDVVNVCRQVDYTSDDTPTDLHCADALSAQLVPQDVVDLADFVVAVANIALYQYGTAADVYACPVFRAAAPGSGPVSITPDGDVSLGGDGYWDCPPYANPAPSPEAGYPLAPTGAGWDDGTTGFLALTGPWTSAATYPAPTDPHDVAASCAFRVDRDTGSIDVLGHATTDGPDTATVHCRLLDADRTVVYDRTATASGTDVTLHDTVAAPAGNVSVCTEGASTGARTGFHCRYAS